ncbi:MAG: SDR family oxidoreductase, partial [Gammaproteobacteria bacterium]|nr:SDR family oxidoreductase [Gammaproteobacteria bacterium]
MHRLEGRIALITGAAAGIGKASAELFAAEGAALGLIDINDADGEALAAAINAGGGTARYVHADVANAAAVEHAIEALTGELGGLDVLYNNAGGATPRDDHLLTMPLAEFDHAIGLNLYGPFAACRFAIPHMTARGGGSIINTASIRAMIGTAGADGYTAAKGGIVTLTRALALQCAPKGIRVNAIAPGAVLTERVKKLMAQGND